MIQELFTLLTTRSSFEAKAFGHIYEAIAIGAREKRCQKFWQNHREESKKLILKIANGISEKNSLLILGSGPLHEIPIEELSTLFNSITLVDIIHLRATKRKYRHLENLIFIEHDITELESIIAKEKKITNKVPITFLNQDFNLVISANILSQLAYHLRNYIEKNLKTLYSINELDIFSNQVSQDHYSYLKSFHCPVLLITDIETHFKNKAGESVDKQVPYIDFEFPVPVASWNWDVAPIPEYSSEISLQMKVAGFILNK
jgi:hypothetical protein